ncbi:MAG: sensor histidine kinase [Lachnospirales bacterium]
MKQFIKKVRRYMESNLRRQLEFYLILFVLLPMTLVTILLFIGARQELKNQAIIHVRQSSLAISQQIDKFLSGILNVSDTFAYDAELEKLMNTDYRKRELEKRTDIYTLQNYFIKTDPLRKNQRISAVYTNQGRVFNLVNPNWDGEDLKEKLASFEPTDKQNLSMFKWFPLQKKFLSSASSGQPRIDNIVVGMRRIMDPFTGVWQYTQFFCIEENEIYQLYRSSAQEMGGTVFLLDKNGELISSSDERCVETGALPKELQDPIMEWNPEETELKYQGQKYILDHTVLEESDWQLLLMVPVSYATTAIDSLLTRMMAALAVCVLLCGVLLTWLSKRFLQPVEVLDASMREVYDGNMEAYVNPELYNGEIQKMMVYYNAMLVKINHSIEEQVANEKKKKELELEVLMGQINPHFLYNTLENIVWKSNEAGYPDIGRVAASLGRLYRLSIGNGEILVSLRQEVEHVSAYINIQKNRYKDRVEFSLTADLEKLGEYSIIKLTLQPIVENCFMYAMEGIDHPLKIRLDIQIREEIILIRIADNGSGLSRERLEEVRRQIEYGKVQTSSRSGNGRKGAGIGMYSVKERIAIYTGYPDSLKIQSRLGSGTIVTIKFPKLCKEDKNNQ